MLGEKMFESGTVFDVTEFIDKYNQMAEQVKSQQIIISMLRAKIKVLNAKCEYLSEISRSQR